MKDGYEPDGDLLERASRTRRIVRNTVVAVLAAAFAVLTIWWILGNFTSFFQSGLDRGFQFF